MREVHVHAADGRAFAVNWYDGDKLEDLATSMPGVERIETPEGEQLWPVVVEVPALPLCVDCEHHRGPKCGANSHLCIFRRSLEPEISLVTGKPKTRPLYDSCEALRDDSDQCGPQGAWFVARNS